MHSKNIPLFIIVASLTSKSLGLHPPSLAITVRRSFDLIMARQTSSAKCNETCSAIELSVNACPSFSGSCICTSAVFNGIQECFNCAVPFNSVEDEEDAARELEQICSNLNVQGLPSLTVPAPPSTSVNTNTGAPESTGTPIGDTTTALPSSTGLISTIIEPSSTSTSSPDTGTDLSSGSTSTSLSTVTNTGSALGSLSTASGPGSLSTSTSTTSTGV